MSAGHAHCAKHLLIHHLQRRQSITKPLIEFGMSFLFSSFATDETKQFIFYRFLSFYFHRFNKYLPCKRREHTYRTHKKAKRTNEDIRVKKDLMELVVESRAVEEWIGICDFGNVQRRYHISLQSQIHFYFSSGMSKVLLSYCIVGLASIMYDVIKLLCRATSNNPIWLIKSDIYYSIQSQHKRSIGRI